MIKGIKTTYNKRIEIVRFWGIIKSEMYYLKKFHTFDELHLEIDNYIEFYNNKRLQKKLKGLTPIEYREQTLVA
ncbi:IS3 family transposase [[Clostridium] dakarense]|uniref:IS3 family transposase n=1 Tax=Faecalimicrobium dakarense TaxID=1301100 RepID=UPI0004BB87F8|nr:IS3 family transposase [[Clostridium] dakarense]